MHHGEITARELGKHLLSLTSISGWLVPGGAALSNGPEIKQSPFEWNSDSNPRSASNLTLHGETVLFGGICLTVKGLKGGSPILSKEH